MTYVSIAMTLKEKPSLPNASHLSLHVRRMRGQVGATSRPWWRFACHDGAVHHQHFHPDQTITKQYYIEVLRQLRDAVRRKQSQLWASGDWQLHHDMRLPILQPSCMLVFFGGRGANYHITLVCQPPYSPHLTPCDFWLYPKLQSPLKGRRFVNVTVTHYTRSVNGVSLPTD